MRDIKGQYIKKQAFRNGFGTCVFTIINYPFRLTLESLMTFSYTTFCSHGYSQDRNLWEKALASKVPEVPACRSFNLGAYLNVVVF